MKIGIDLDGVIFDSEKLFRVQAELYDLIHLNRNSIIDNREVKFQDRYNWSEEETQNFQQKYRVEIVTESNFMPGAEKVLKLLKKEGHQLIIITARGGKHKDEIQITLDILKKYGMDIFDKYFWGIENKEEKCVSEKIDLMIDDSDKKCKAISNAGIKTIYFKDAPNFEMEENQNLKVLYNWGEVYRYIKGK